MNPLNIYLLFPIFWIHLFSNLILAQKENSTLKLVHVIFRHGDRNPDEESIYPGDPYGTENYFKEGYGQLTDKGKSTSYKLGKELRNLYDKFLTDSWNIKYLSVRSTDYNRTKMSLELVLASLYPPRGSNQLWSIFNWLPIPYNYLPLKLDKEMFPKEACGTNLRILWNELLKTRKISNYLKRYDEMGKIFEIHANTSSLILLYNMYFGLTLERELGYPLEPWTSAVYPEPLHSAVIDFYYLFTNTTALRRIMTGYFIKQILEDVAAKINGTIEPPERKMFLYSAHETNIAGILLSLDLVRLTQVPPYGSYVLFEVHEINRIYGIKLFYQFYENGNPLAIKLPGCDYFCPYDDFYKLVKHILPESDDECFSSKNEFQYYGGLLSGIFRKCLRIFLYLTGGF